jgi:beta-glucosidase
VTAPESASDDVVATVHVRNTGDRAGREVVQLYAARPDSAIERPARWLAGFATVDLAAGESADVDVRLAPRALQHWSDDGWTTEPGTFTLHAGRSLADLRLTANVDLG